MKALLRIFLPGNDQPVAELTLEAEAPQIKVSSPDWKEPVHLIDLHGPDYDILHFTVPGTHDPV